MIAISNNLVLFDYLLTYEISKTVQDAVNSYDFVKIKMKIEAK